MNTCGKRIVIFFLCSPHIGGRTAGHHLRKRRVRTSCRLFPASMIDDEFLHQGINNFYRHVGNTESEHGNVAPYVDNVMFYGTEIGERLLYRTLGVLNGEIPEPTPYSQWKKIRE